MYNMFWKRSRSGAIPWMLLDSVWRVDADETYHIHPTKIWTSTSCIAIRTSRGRGLLRYVDGREVCLEADTLIFLDPEQILEYGTAGSCWDFCWFEFRADMSLGLQKDVICRIPFSAEEKEQTRECYLNLGSTRREIDLLGQAEFAKLLLGWLAFAPDADIGSRQDLIQLLEKGDKQNLSIPQIAREAGMCQRSFRSEINRLTGYSPSEYLRKMKMDTALEMLLTTDKTIQEVADSLNFGNPFYFSRVFKQYFGISPGKARKCVSAPEN